MHSCLECALCCYVQFCALSYSCSCLAVHFSCSTLPCSCIALPCSTVLQLYCPAIACLAAALPCSTLQLYYLAVALRCIAAGASSSCPLSPPPPLYITRTTHIKSTKKLTTHDHKNDHTSHDEDYDALTSVDDSDDYDYHGDLTKAHEQYNHRP